SRHGDTSYRRRRQSSRTAAVARPCRSESSLPRRVHFVTRPEVLPRAHGSGMRIILDVSTSLAWTRPPVGIVRTEQKFAAFLLGRRDVSVAFCRFDRARRRHVVVPRAVVERRLAGAEVALPPPAPVPGGAAPIEPRRIPGSRARRVAARWVERGVARLPARLHPEAALVTSSARDLAKALYWLVRKAWHPP